MSIIKVCAWCNKPIGFFSRYFGYLKIKVQVSHGICWDCKEEQLKRLENVSESKKYRADEQPVGQEIA